MFLLLHFCFLSWIKSFCAEITPGSYNEFYPAFKRGITGGCVKLDKNWKSQSIFSKIEKKANNKIYHLTTTNPSCHLHPRTASDHHRNGHRRHHYSSQVSTTTVTNGILKDHNCLIVGGGPCGLRTAIELQLLGARHVVVIEKRDRLSRNNVLHLWPFVIHDLKSMAGKKFHGKFCAGKSKLHLFCLHSHNNLLMKRKTNTVSLKFTVHPVLLT